MAAINAIEGLREIAPPEACMQERLLSERCRNTEGRRREEVCGSLAKRGRKRKSTLLSTAGWQLDMDCRARREPNGFRDTDSQSARLDDLGEILRQLLGGSVDPSKPAGSGSDPAAVAWQQRDLQLLDIVTPKALAGCQQHGGFKDTAGAQ